MQLTTLSTVHGLYYLITGIWPIINIHSFMLVTGPKTDLWLVKTLGMVISVIGITLLFSAYRKNLSKEIFVLATGVAFGFFLIDIIFYTLGQISAVYLADAAVEFTLLALWILGLGKSNLNA